MRVERKILALSIALGVYFWIIDALVDSLIFYDESFLQSLLLDVAPIEIYMRSLVLVLCLVLESTT